MYNVKPWRVPVKYINLLGHPNSLVTFEGRHIMANWCRRQQLNVIRSSSKVSNFNQTWNSWSDFNIISQIPNFAKILPVAAELKHADIRTDWTTKRHKEANMSFSRTKANVTKKEVVFLSLGFSSILTGKTTLQGPSPFSDWFCSWWHNLTTTMIREFDYTHKLTVRSKLFQRWLDVYQKQKDKLLLTLSCHISLIIIKNNIILNCLKNFEKVIYTIILYYSDRQDHICLAVIWIIHMYCAAMNITDEFKFFFYVRYTHTHMHAWICVCVCVCRCVCVCVCVTVPYN